MSTNRLSSVAETATPAPADADSRPRSTSPSACSRCSSKVGNAAFGRMVARWAQTQGRTLAREDLPTEAEIKEAEAWAATGPFEGKDLTPGVGGAGLNNAPGGFDAKYDPSQDELTITMRCGVEWVDGIGKDGKAAKGLEKQLEKIKKLPTEAQRQEQLALFRWPEAKTAAEKTTFMTGVESTIEPFWSGNHQFFLRKKGWSWLGANVKVDIVVKDKEDIADQHMHDQAGEGAGQRQPGRQRRARPGDQRARPGHERHEQHRGRRQLPQPPRHVRGQLVGDRRRAGDQPRERGQDLQGRRVEPRRRRHAQHPDPGRADRPRERDRRPGAQPGALRAARGGGRGFMQHQGLRQRREARHRLRRRRHHGRPAARTRTTAASTS